MWLLILLFMYLGLKFWSELIYVYLLVDLLFLGGNILNLLLFFLVVILNDL